jgi:uncharacterized protein YbaP (TraB family)
VEVSVHNVLVANARTAGKDIRTESPDVDATLAFFGTMTDEVENEYLFWTLDRLGEPRRDVDRRVAAWMIGDASVVDDELGRMKVRYPALYARLIVDRNREWVPRIGEMLRRANAFVLVGDSHMATDGGLPDLARAGFRPRRADDVGASR